MPTASLATAGPGQGRVPGGSGEAVPRCLMSMGRSNMSVSNRDVPVAKAVFFI